MIKKVLGIGTGVAALAAVGVVGYRHYTNTGAQPAAAAGTTESSRVITLGAEAAAPVAPGRVMIAPVTPKQMPPKATEPKPATQPATPKAAPAVAPAKAKAAPATSQPTTKPSAAKVAAPAKKAKVISLTGDAQANAGSTAASPSKLTPQEKHTLALVKQLQSLRATIGTWRSQNGGAIPNFVQNPMWEEFLRDAGGRLAGKPPVNPLNGRSRVLPVEKDPAAGEAASGEFGYVFAVTTGRLFATDAMGRVFDEAGVDAVGLEARAAREMPAKDQEKYLLATIDAVRQQIALYAMQHGQRPPDFAKYPAFEQLMGPTLADGRLAEAGKRGLVYGPYIYSAPINPFNGRHKVALLPGELRPGQRIERDDVGFVYSGSTNRLFAVDASGLVYDDTKARAGYVAPEAGGTGTAAAKGAAAEAAALNTLRNFLAQYQRHHNGAMPDFKRYPRWEQLTGKTRADGKPNPAGMFGPYLFKTPVNSKNNSSDVDVVGRIIKGYRPKKAAGYVFDTSTGQIYLTDEVGAVVIDEVADVR